MRARCIRRSKARADRGHRLADHSTRERQVLLNVGAVQEPSAGTGHYLNMTEPSIAAVLAESRTLAGAADLDRAGLYR